MISASIMSSRTVYGMPATSCLLLLLTSLIEGDAIVCGVECVVFALPGLDGVTSGAMVCCVGCAVGEGRPGGEAVVSIVSDPIGCESPVSIASTCKLQYSDPRNAMVREENDIGNPTTSSQI